MLVTCHGIELSDAFLSVSKAISNKITNPILEGIKIVAEDDTLTLSATDTELSIERKIKANIKVEGEAVVPGKFITEFIKKLGKENNGNILNLFMGKKDIKFEGMQDLDYEEDFIFYLLILDEDKYILYDAYYDEKE